MKIVNQSVELITEKDPLKKIELAGRVCYKSEDKITHNSAVGFVERLLNRRHLSVLEHVRVAMTIPLKDYYKLRNEVRPDGYLILKYFVVNDEGSHVVFDGNLRAWRDLLNYAGYKEIVEKIYTAFLASDEYAAFFEDFDTINYRRGVRYKIVEEATYYTVKVICDRAIANELVRHRVCGFSQESTRYCNYLKKGLSFVRPFGLTGIKKFLFDVACRGSGLLYNALLLLGAKAEFARCVLILGLKTELVFTCTKKELEGIFELRLSKKAHPQVREIMLLLSTFPAIRKEFDMLINKLVMENDL